MMEDFGDKCVDIIQNVLGLGGAQVQFTDDQKKMQGNILDIFCEKHLPELADFIMASCPERPGDTVGSHRGAKSEVLLAICELMCSCVQLDPSRKNFLHNNVTEKVLLLTRRKETFLVAAAVRFVSNLLSVHNDNVQSYIVENNTLKPIIDVFAADGHRDNLLSSAVLALLVHIYKVPIFSSFSLSVFRGVPSVHITVLRVQYNAVLAKYVVGTFWDQLAPFEHLTSIQDFKTTYVGLIESRRPKSTNEQSDMIQYGSALDEEKSAEPQNSNVTAARTAMKEAEPHSSNVIAAASSGASSTQMEEAEPHSSNVIAASSACQSKRSGGLVDYEDSESDEDCREIDQQEQRKRPRLSPTSEENKKSSQEQGGEAKEPGEL
ncbi:PREDICTED: putative SMEK homolog 3 isoform X1 [Camelina sativa]|uniref:SMEK homolog 3 isoform X1 n=1 Tax=Camelina sativa TaxID=90675 RepID=A0ABM1QV05_CAMSA|nr:PREDICTED: putative SMEK homolog 3 isoform X1 [Camelina sativa]